MITVGRVAAGEDQTIEEAGEEIVDEAVESGRDFLVHIFHLRPGMRIELELPNDLRPDEAKRLSEFIRTLPFDVEP